MLHETARLYLFGAGTGKTTGDPVTAAGTPGIAHWTLALTGGRGAADIDEVGGRRTQPRRLDRLSSLGASTLRPEYRGLPIHAALILLDGRTPASVLEMFQIGVVQGNVPVSVGLLSCPGRLNFTIAGDPVAVPDLAVFAQGTSGALSHLDALPVRTFGPV
jgi:hypothetical protein